MGLDRAQAEQHMWMEVSTRVSGNPIRSKGTACSNTSMEQNMMENGVVTRGTVMEPISTQMEINMKVTGSKILNKEWALTTMSMVISIKGSGRQENLMVRETTSIKAERLSTRETGKMAKRKALVNWLSRTIMAIQGNGRITRKMEEAVTYTLTHKSTKACGLETKSQEMEPTSIKMGISISEAGKMTEGMDREK
jgi:predicted GNAT family acetyltransferase